MATIFGNVRLERGQFRHLMASRVIDVIARAQGTPAMPTRIGDQINSHVHAPGWDQRSRVAGMSRLSTGLPSTLRAAPPCALAASEPIGGRGFRRGRRVLLTQGQLAFQIGDPFLRLGDLLRLLGDLPIALSNLATKPVILSLQSLLRVRAAPPPFGLRHSSHGTLIASTCTVSEKHSSQPTGQGVGCGRTAQPNQRHPAGMESERIASPALRSWAAQGSQGRTDSLTESTHFHRNPSRRGAAWGLHLRTHDFYEKKQVGQGGSLCLRCTDSGCAGDACTVAGTRETSRGVAGYGCEKT